MIILGDAPRVVIAGSSGEGKRIMIMDSPVVVMGTEHTINTLRAELTRAAENAAAETAARVKAEEALAAFRRSVVATALAEASERSWRDEIYDVLDSLGLDEADGVPPAEREESVRVNIDVRLDVTVERGQEIDAEQVEEALIEWIRDSFTSRHWSARDR